MTPIDPLAPDQDQFLRQLNGLLSSHHRESLADNLTERFPTIHVIGVPRSGTTLTMQLMASALPISYPSNLSAVLWSAPVYGVALARKLLDGQFQSSLQSNYGRTSDPAEPHEFGRFWLELLGYETLEEKPGHQIDYDLVRNTILNMVEAAQGPFAFKSFLPVWHLDALAEIFSKSLFVHVTRDPLENGLSLIKARQEFGEGGVNWVGLRPAACRKFDADPVEMQVASQVIEVERAIAQRLSNVPKSRIIDVRVEDLTLNPSAFLDEVVQRLGLLGAEMKVQSFPNPTSDKLPLSETMPPEIVSGLVDAFETLGMSVKSNSRNI